MQNAIDVTVDKISKGFKLGNVLEHDLPILNPPEGLELEQYSRLTLSHAEQFGTRGKSIKTALGLTAGCIQLMLIAISKYHSLPASETPLQHDTSDSLKVELIRWEARASIMNTVFNELWSTFGSDSYRVIWT